jgi:RNA processing factor Prp31
LQALFRALKTKHETPKYGLIYHASLIGQAAPKFKGKISRVLAAKSALSIRMDALGDDTSASIGIESRAKVGMFNSTFSEFAWQTACNVFLLAFFPQLIH